MSRLSYFLLISAILVSCAPKVAIDKDKEHIDAVCDNFMLDFKNGKITNAMQLIKSNCVIIPASTIDTLEAQTFMQIKQGGFKQYGEVISYEFITERKIKDFAAKRYYVLKFKDYFLKFVFSLYNGGSGWKIAGFKYDAEISELF